MILRVQHQAKQPSNVGGSILRKIGSRAQVALARLVRAPDVMAAGAFLFAYVGLEWVSFIHEHRGVPVTPWNPGLGVAFALLVLKGAAYGFVLFAGVIIAEIFVLQTELGWPVILAIAVLLSGTYTAAAAVARRYLRLDIGLGHVRDVLVLLAVGVAGAAISAGLLSLLLLAAGELGTSDLSRSSLRFLLATLSASP
jgi:uncharacterized membrane protein